MKKSVFTILLTLALSAILAAAAPAETSPDRDRPDLAAPDPAAPVPEMPEPARWNFELYAGAYTSGIGILGYEGIVGVRGGYRLSDFWGIEGTLGHTAPHLDIPYVVDVDLDATFLDVSVLRYLNPGRKAEVFLYGGAGMAFFDASADPWFHSHHYRHHTYHLYADDTASLHAGVGVAIALTGRMYLRPDVRARWIDSFDDSAVDWETDLGIGWKF